jgi:hypothetical protein
MPRVGTDTLIGFPGRTGPVLRTSGGGVVFAVSGEVAFDDGFVGTTDAVPATRGVDGDGPGTDDGPAAVVCCRPSSALLSVLNCT